ncbi:acyl carrier protein [bacterium]|nr:acyl carrier protein [bacterium]
MTDTEIVNIINDSMIKEFEFDPDTMIPDAHLVNDLGMDSLDFVDLVVVLQNVFGVKLRDEPKVRQIETLGDLHKLVMEKKKELEAGGK